METLLSFKDLLLEGLSNTYLLSFFIAFVFYQVLGATWYNLKVFGTMWAKDARIDLTKGVDKKAAMRGLLIGMAAAGVGLFHLAIILQPALLRATVGNQLLTILLITLVHGFILAMNYAYEERPVRLWVINISFVFLLLAVLGISTALQYQLEIGLDRLEKFTFKWEGVSMGMVPWLALPIGIVIHQVVGYVWYGPLFGQAWRKEMEGTGLVITKEKAMKSMGKALVFTVLAYTALTLALAARANLHGIEAALLIGPPMLVFHAMMIGMHCAFEQRSLRYFLITAGYPMLTMTIYCALYGIMADSFYPA